MNKARGLLYRLAVGAVLMDIFDPDRGLRRRALMRDQFWHTRRQSGELIDKKMRDLQNSVASIVAETRAKLRGEMGDQHGLAKHLPLDENPQIEPESGNRDSFKQGDQQRPGSTIDQNDCVDVAAWESFPASDPPAWISSGQKGKTAGRPVRGHSPSPA
jgi:hypothetical protein